MRADTAENALSLTVLGAMTALALIEVGGRVTVGRGIPGSIVLVQHLTLWVAMLGAALAARSDRLLALSTAQFLPARARGRIPPVATVTSTISAPAKLAVRARSTR